MLMFTIIVTDRYLRAARNIRTPGWQYGTYIWAWERKISLVHDGRAHVRRRPNWLHGVFWPARKIDKNVRINAGLAAQGQPVAILLSYISPSLVLKTFHRRALANIWLAFASLALFYPYFSSSPIFLLLLSFSFSRSFSPSITIIVPFALVCLHVPQARFPSFNLSFRLSVRCFTSWLLPVSPPFLPSLHSSRSLDSVTFSNILISPPSGPDGVAQTKLDWTYRCENEFFIFYIFLHLKCVSSRLLPYFAYNNYHN